MKNLNYIFIICSIFAFFLISTNNDSQGLGSAMVLFIYQIIFFAYIFIYFIYLFKQKDKKNLKNNSLSIILIITVMYFIVLMLDIYNFLYKTTYDKEYDFLGIIFHFIVYQLIILYPLKKYLTTKGIKKNILLIFLYCLSVFIIFLTLLGKYFTLI